MCTHTLHTHTLHSKLPAALLRGTEIKWSSGSWGISWLSFLWPPVSNGKQAAGKANIAWLTQPEKLKFVQSHISSQVAEWSRICLPMEKMQVQFLGQEDPPLQNSCLENSTDRRVWQAPWGHKELDTTEHAHTHTHTHTHTHIHTSSLLKAYVTSQGITQVIYILKKKYLQTSTTLLDLKHNSELQSYICIFTK